MQRRVASVVLVTVLTAVLIVMNFSSKHLEALYAGAGSDAENAIAGPDTEDDETPNSRPRFDTAIAPINVSISVGVAFVFPSGNDRKGFIVALHSACKTSSTPYTLNLFVLLREADKKYEHKLTMHWSSAKMPCPLSVLVFSSDTMNWASALEVPNQTIDARKLAGETSSFLQHVNLPAEIGKRGVDMAVIADSTVLFQGHDPVRKVLEQCATKLVNFPRRIGCTKFEKMVGWDTGAWVVNTSLWAREAWDRQLWAFHLGTKQVCKKRYDYTDCTNARHLVNRYLQHQSEASVSWIHSPSRPQQAPCDSPRIVHVDGPGPKPWASGACKVNDAMLSDDLKFHSAKGCKASVYCEWKDYFQKIGKVNPLPPGFKD